jgi:hypothetical protein
MASRLLTPAADYGLWAIDSPADCGLPTLDF